MNYEITAVIPTLNSAGTIERAIKSIQNQTLKVSETIVVDNGSTDDTINLVRKLNAQNTRILICESRGASFARNLGIAASRTQWIAFLDSDDAWAIDKLKIQLEYLNSLQGENKVSLIFSGKSTEGSHVGKSGRLSLFDLMVGNSITTSSVLVKREALLNSADQTPFNTNISFGEDWLLWLQIATIGEIHLVDFGLVEYTKSPIKKYRWDIIESSFKLILRDYLVFIDTHATMRNKALVKRTMSHSVYIHLFKYALQLNQLSDATKYLLLALSNFSLKWYVTKAAKIRLS